MLDPKPKPEDEFEANQRNDEQQKLHQCRLTPWYVFDQCRIQSCKNHSPVLASKCLLIERLEVANIDKGLTDYEIRFFKDYKSMRHLTRDKRLATKAVYSLLILDKFLEFCGTQKPRPLDTTKIDPLLTKLFNRYPLNIKELCVPQDRLYYLFHPGCYKRFLRVQHVSCTDFALNELLGISPKTLRRIRRFFMKQTKRS